jgi:polyphosphate kinase
MYRNLHRRVETCFPIERRDLRERVIRELGYYLRDNLQAWELQSDGSYRRADGSSEPFSAQQTLLLEMAQSGEVS